MGTRHLTVVKNKHEQDILVMYGQYDGYLEGHGQRLGEFLDGMKLVNGLVSEENIANGMACLAGQIIAHFKEKAGGFYLYPSGTRDVGEEFIYTVTQKDNDINITVTEGPMTFFGAAAPEGKHADTFVFEGTPKELLKFIEGRKEE
jgi:hypothetical protein